MTTAMLTRAVGLLALCGLLLVLLTSCTIVLEVGRQTMALPLPKKTLQPARSTRYEVYTRSFLPYFSTAAQPAQSAPRFLSFC